MSRVCGDDKKVKKEFLMNMLIWIKTTFLNNFKQLISCAAK